MAAYIPTLQGFAKFTASTCAGLLAIVAGALYVGQTYMIYPSFVPPGSRESVATPLDYHIPYDDLELVAADGVKVKAYLMKQRKEDRYDSRALDNLEVAAREKQTDDEYAKTRPTVLFFHANAGNVGHRIPYARIFYSRMRCNVIMLSYRGYGLSEGKPSEKGIRMDAQATLNYVLSHPVLKSTKLIYYGQSIGGAVAIDLASRNPSNVHALILENTFLSIPLVAKQVMPYVTPFLFLCTERWRSDRAIKLVPSSTHILLLSGLEDELVPPSHMKSLWNTVTQGGKERRAWAEFEFGNHNNTCLQPGYWQRVMEFVKEITSDPSSKDDLDDDL